MDLGRPCIDCAMPLVVDLATLATGPAKSRCQFACHACGHLYLAPTSVTVVARVIWIVLGLSLFAGLGRFETFLPLTMAVGLLLVFPITALVHYWYFRG